MQPYLTIEETISIPRLSRLAVSEDGTRLAWVETVANWDKNEYRKHVQIYDVRTKQITCYRRIINPIRLPVRSPIASLGSVRWVQAMTKLTRLLY